MTSFEIEKDDASGQKVLKTSLRGRELLKDSYLNKGVAFSQQERDIFGLNGLLPPHVHSIQAQLARNYAGYLKQSTDLERHVFLRNLQDRNETLFYRLLVDHIAEMLPIVYTPVVGQACQHFHAIYRQPRGLFLSYPLKDKMEEMISNIDLPEVKVIVVSDGERILGLGDQGMGGMGIPIGKISLYTACGGIFPGVALPIFLDTGTDNEQLLNDPLYLGWRHRRIRGADYDAFVDCFVEAVMKRFPKALLQWEDFAKDQARTILERYQNKLCTFNDDVQGTAAVALSGVLSALEVIGSDIAKQRILIYGAGSAGTGIADYLVLAMQHHGLSEKEAHNRIWMMNRAGLLNTNMKGLSSFQLPYAHDAADVTRLQINPDGPIVLEDAISKIQPTILIGVSGTPNVFNEGCVKAMAKHVNRPIIFPLSNPTSQCEGIPEDLIQWTDGKAIVATGTRFPDVHYKGKTFRIGQCNNYYIFPAMGLAVIAAGATRVTAGMFLAATEALSKLSPAIHDASQALFPPPEQVRDVARKLAFAIGLQAQKEGVAPPSSPQELQKNIEENFWSPDYTTLKAAFR